MINLMTLAVGTRLKLIGDVVAEVTENVQDGQWVKVRILSVAGNPAHEGAEELAHAQDILCVLDQPSR